MESAIVPVSGVALKSIEMMLLLPLQETPSALQGSARVALGTPWLRKPSSSCCHALTSAGGVRGGEGGAGPMFSQMAGASAELPMTLQLDDIPGSISFVM